ncbi:acyl-phosphate glycerol 3-phosphate acyltransferase [candidate division TA06 bacterium]|uniref:Glycerol-3-phosphate acyltransferase n=1 Tax=candidate division TA06 bacterium TaxID=2250710 RepID=A0A660SAV2_UNCT6|nr:MAG: acyl-phosphate glycerol 3-phosphate acyltransferase [candidate division TA06 bacterium]
MNLIMILIFVLISFLIGGIPFGYLYVKFRYKKDIRTMGSGNIGSTNVYRNFGKRDGAIVFIFDFLKGFLIVLISRFYYDISISMFFGIAAILGHVFSIYLKFKGGKGVATTLGVFIAIAPFISFLSIIVWLIITKFTKYVSLASMIAIGSFPIFIFISQYLGSNRLLNEYNTTVFLTSAVIFLLVLFSHRTNIQRLIKGIEHKIGGK